MTEKYISATIGYISAALCALSVIVCLLVISLLFKKNDRHLFRWKIVQRFVLVGSLCNLMFYASQLTFGVHVAITKEVPGHAVCSTYAFLLLYAAGAQCRLTLVIAATAYYLIIKKKQINFGRYNWKLFILMFTDPLVILSIAAALDGMDYNGAYCGLKEGKGVLWNFLFTFVPLSAVLLFITVIYSLIWIQIYKEGKRIAETIVDQCATSKSLVKVTQNMSFFIVVFFLRFSFPAVHGIWVYITDPPAILYQIVTIATCAGRLFNGAIYLTVRRNHL